MSGDCLAQARELRGQLKRDWAELWRTKLEDEVRAEGISSRDYWRLFVERGEILFASRDCKPPSFGEILEKNLGAETASKVSLDPSVGGWRRFAREHLQGKKGMVVEREPPRVRSDLSQAQRKNGAGWLNRGKIWRKMDLNLFDY